jgi:hypothetical protein
VIIEYMTDHEVTFQRGTAVLKYGGVRSVNLRYVTSARPYYHDATAISVLGDNKSFVINVDYERFMRDWRSAKP